jgi:small subunit ribosomal protein S13
MVFLDKNSKKKIDCVLNDIAGLGKFQSKLICKRFGFQKNCNLTNLNSSTLESLKNYLSSNYILDKSLVQTTNNNVKIKMDLGTYEGKRHNLGYPVRGQRTLSNGKTQRHLHKFRFHYDFKSFSYNFFKNQRKSNKKKIIKSKILKKKQVRRYEQKFYDKSSSNLKSTDSLKKIQLRKKKENLAYLKKLYKVKSDRRKQIDTKFEREHARARETHPYFLNIKRANDRKKKKLLRKQ